MSHVRHTSPVKRLHSADRRTGSEDRQLQGLEIGFVRPRHGIIRGLPMMRSRFLQNLEAGHHKFYRHRCSGAMTKSLAVRKGEAHSIRHRFRGGKLDGILSGAHSLDRGPISVQRDDDFGFLHRTAKADTGKTCPPTPAIASPVIAVLLKEDCDR